MYNKGKVIIGIIIFILVFSSPLWFNKIIGQPEDVPNIVYPEDETECLYEKDYMRAFHMDVLDEWRDKVVREDIRFAVIKGEKVEMSLTKTCMKCHSNKEEFCDQCHDYLKVDPYCWDCHIMPSEIKAKPKPGVGETDVPAETIETEVIMEETESEETEEAKQ